MSNSKRSSRGRRGSDGRGPFVYDDYRHNHVICPGRDSALKAFVEQKYGGLQHKLRNAHSSNSEDALTWSCFDALRHVGAPCRQMALAEIWELAFHDLAIPTGVGNGEIHIGKTYGESKERTEVDLSIEGPGVLVFFEAKLPIASLSNLNQGVSLKEAETAKASGFGSKWLTSYWFTRYKHGCKGSLAPLEEVLARHPTIEGASGAQLAGNMGWLTWADVFKPVLRAVLADRGLEGPPATKSG